jgi:predicted RNA-binding Zn ribbon-like protein
MALPSWVDPDEDKPAPMPLLRVQSFINTRDIERDTDLLLDPEGARVWLTAAGLTTGKAPISAAELREARSVREGLRALVSYNSGEDTPNIGDLKALQSFAGRRRPTVSVDAAGRVQLAPTDKTDLRDGLLGLLLTVRDAQADGTWARLKLCANSECEWAFFDRSRNRQGAWCTMAVCGNRLKNRRFRAREH